MQADPRPATLNAQLSAQLQARLKNWAAEFGFADAAVSRIALDEDAAHLQRWLAAGRHGSMAYMARDPALRSEPERLQPGTVTVISARMPASGPECSLMDVTCRIERSTQDIRVRLITDAARR